jgi:hypothetical protein
MATVDLSNPCTFAGAVKVEHSDIPAELTIAEWRAQRATQARQTKADRRAVRRGRLVAMLALSRWRRRREPAS